VKPGGNPEVSKVFTYLLGKLLVRKPYTEACSVHGLGNASNEIFWGIGTYRSGDFEI
jgi:hypothetical protein